jgi:hypothetical protein
MLEEKKQAKNNSMKVQVIEKKAVKGKPLRVEVKEMTT